MQKNKNETHVDKLWYFAAARVKRLLRYIGQRGTREGLPLNTEQMNSLHYTALLCSFGQIIP